MPGQTAVGKSDLLVGDAGDIAYPYYLINGRIPARSPSPGCSSHCYPQPPLMQFASWAKVWRSIREPA